MPSPSWPEFWPQQYPSPEVASAQVWYIPELTAEKATPAGISTGTGEARCVVDPSPSWPYVLEPQQYALPCAVRPQVCEFPPDSVTIDGDDPIATGTNGVTYEFEEAPFPSCPYVLEPQQYVVLIEMAQAWLAPVAITLAATPFGTAMATGESAYKLPQQETDPELVRAQV